MNWLPAEPEKVEFFEKLGLPRRLIPRRIYYGIVGNQKRYFALKLPLAVDPETVTFAYVDPGHSTDTELRSWGAAHRPLWDALRTKGRQVRVIGIAVENTNRGPDGAVARSMGGGGARDTRRRADGKAGDQGDSRGDRPQGPGISGAVWRIRGSRETVCGASTSPGSQGHGRGLD